MAYDMYLPLKLMSGAYDDRQLSEVGGNIAGALKQYRQNTILDEQRRIKEEERQRKLKQEQDLASAVSGAMQGGEVNLANIGKEIASTDPRTALNLYQKQQELDAKRMSATSPDAVRTKLASIYNQVNNRIAQSVANDPTLPGMQNLAGRIEKELSADVPSIQRAFTLINEGEQKLQTTPSAGVTPMTGMEEPVTELPSGVSSEGGVAIRNNKISTTPTDWFKMTQVDGEMKPELYAGLNELNMPSEVKTRFDERMDNWEKNNDTAVSRRAEGAKREAGSKIAKRFAGSIDKTYTKLSAIATQLTSLIQKYNSGDYNLANFADLKGTMADGRMTDSDVGLALGLSVSEGLLQNLRSWATGGNAGVEALNDKDAARTAINRTIDEYNKTMSNMYNPQFRGKNGEYAKQAWDEGSYSTQFDSLPKSFDKISGTSAPKVRGLTAGTSTPEIGVQKTAKQRLLERMRKSGGK